MKRGARDLHARRRGAGRSPARWPGRGPSPGGRARRARARSARTRRSRRRRGRPGPCVARREHARRPPARATAIVTGGAAVHERVGDEVRPARGAARPRRRARPRGPAPRPRRRRRRRPRPRGRGRRARRARAAPAAGVLARSSASRSSTRRASALRVGARCRRAVSGSAPWRARWSTLPRSAVSGVRSSCEASARNRRSRVAARSSAASIAFSVWVSSPTFAAAGRGRRRPGRRVRSMSPRGGGQAPQRRQAAPGEQRRGRARRAARRRAR